MLDSHLYEGTEKLYRNKKIQLSTSVLCGQILVRLHYEISIQFSYGEHETRRTGRNKIILRKLEDWFKCLHLFYRQKIIVPFKSVLMHYFHR